MPLIDISDSGGQAEGTPPVNKPKRLVSKAVMSVHCRYMLQMDCVLQEDKVGGVGWTLVERAAARVDIWNTLVHHDPTYMTSSPTDLDGLVKRGDTAMYRILHLHENPPPDTPGSLDEHQGSLIDIINNSPTLRMTPQWRKMIDVKRHIFKKKGTPNAAEYKEKQRMNAQVDQFDRFQL